MANNFSYLVSYYISVGSTIDNLWNIFMGVHLVLFASIYKIGKKINNWERLFVFCAYLCFAFMNFRAIVIQYNMLLSIKNDIIEETIRSSSEALNKNLAEFFINYGYSDRITITTSLHAAAAVAIFTYLFITRKPKTKSNGASAPYESTQS